MSLTPDITWAVDPVFSFPTRAVLRFPMNWSPIWKAPPNLPFSLFTVSAPANVSFCQFLTESTVFCENIPFAVEKGFLLSASESDLVSLKFPISDLILFIEALMKAL